jgi:multicomponent Na+:H+ antiporter subunit D
MVRGGGGGEYGGTVTGSSLLIMFTVIPLFASLFIIIVERLHRDSGDLIANASTFSTLILSLLMLRDVSSNNVLVYHMGGWQTPLGIDLVLDSFGVLMLIVVNLVSFMVTLYSVDYMRHYTSKAKYYTLLLLLITGLNGLVLSGDIFNMYVFIEMASIASYALVAFGCRMRDLEASFRYQVLGTVASFFILFAIGLVYGVTGTLDLADMSNVLRSGANSAVYLSIPLFLFGFSLKAALVPFHAWLPDAHPTAPAPVSAMLSGVVIKALSLYGIVRIFFGVVGMTQIMYNILLVAGVISMIFGAFTALSQVDLKRLLAYSSISQIGYIMLGIGLGTPLGIAGGLFHMLNHSVFKSLFFMTAGATEQSTGTRAMEKLGGISNRMPVTSTTSLFASLSLAGIPPFGGFWSKLIIIIAAVQAQRISVAVIAGIVSVVTLAYVLKVQRMVYFGKLKEQFSMVREAPVLMCTSMIMLAAICLCLGIFFPYVLHNIIEPAAQTLILGTQYGQMVMEGG